MFIQTAQTPNPNSLKFLPGRPVLTGRKADFRSPQEAEGSSPLAERLFTLKGVEGVFLSDDFVSVTKSKLQKWTALKPLILGLLMDFFASGEPVVTAAFSRPDPHTDQGGNDGVQNGGPSDLAGELDKQIIELLDTRIRPSVARDGGDIRFQRFENGVVYLELQGACVGCPSSTMTLKVGIENMLKHYLPEVIEVRAVN